MYNVSCIRFKAEIIKTKQKIYDHTAKKYKKKMVTLKRLIHGLYG